MSRKVLLLLEAMTPISHFDTRTGIGNPTNIRAAMRQPVVVNGRRIYVPHVSENALRTVLLRCPLADHLIAALGVAGQVPRAVLNLLYAGGAMKGGAADARDATVVGHAIGRLYPSLALLGGAIDTSILPRSKLRLGAWIVAKEYAEAIRVVMPDLAAEAEKVSAFDLLGDEVRTRGTGDEAEGNQMLYSYEVLPAGTKIVIEMSIDRWADLIINAALGQGLAEWDGYFGGQARQGRGRMRIVESRGVTAPDAYLEHVAVQTELMRSGLVSGTLGGDRVVCAG